MVWISVNTAAELLEISKQYVRKQCALNKYTVQTVSSNVGRGGVSYQIDLASLPERAQIKYWETRNDVTTERRDGKPDPSAAASTSSASGSSPATGEPGKATSPQTPDLTPTLSSVARAKDSGEGLTDSRIQSGTTNEAQRLTRNERNSAVSAGLNAKNREVLERNLEVIEFFKGLRGEEIDSALIQWNSEHGDSLNKRTVYRILQKFRDGGAAAVAGKYGSLAGTSSITDEWWHKFMQVYASQGNQASITACREVVRGYAITMGQIEPDGDFPSRDAFRRRLQHEPQAALNYIRKGKDYHKRNDAFWLKVNSNSIVCGEVFVADHAKFDFFVRTKDGKLSRPWISAMCDYKSRMIVGYDLFTDEPNGNHIIIVMKRSFENFGIPRILLFDNGKDYRRKDIGGGRMAATCDLIDRFRPTIAGDLGIDVRYAIPYNSQTKPIERVFGIFRQYFDKFMPAYVGSDGKQRPDKTKELELRERRKQTSPQTPLQYGEGLESGNEIARNKRNSEVARNKLNGEVAVLEFDEWVKLAKEFINIYNHRVFAAGKAAGLSPVGIWQQDAPAMRAPKAEDLAILCASSGNPVKVTRSTLTDTRTGSRYWAAWMNEWQGSKQMFFMRIDPERPETAFCFFADETAKGIRMGAFAGTAARMESVPLFDDSEKARELLARQMEIKNSVTKYAKNTLKKAVGDALSPEEIMDYMRVSVMASHKAACEARGISAEDPAGPMTIDITKYTGVAREVEAEKTKGVMDFKIWQGSPSLFSDDDSRGKSRRRGNGKESGNEIARNKLNGEVEEEPKIVRFRKYVITKEDEDE